MLSPMRRLLFLVLGGMIVLQGCSKNDRYLYYVEREIPRTLNEEYVVKEMVGNSEIDIIWVIDNSGSMGDEQQDVIDNTKLFMQEFTKNSWIRWKMGLISTDEDEDPYLGFAKGDEFYYNDPDTVGRFQKAVARLGTSGSVTEKSFTPIMNSIKRYPGFLRPGAALAMILVTDANEQSSDYWTSTTVTPQDFLDFIELQKKTLDTSKVYGVFGSEDFGCHDGEGWNYSGSRYESVIVPLGGVTYPICSPDFGMNLANLGKDIVKLANYPKLLLKVRPNPKTIRVLYHGDELKGGLPKDGGLWTYDYYTNTIIFYSLDFSQDENDSVEVVFEEDLGFDD